MWKLPQWPPGGGGKIKKTGGSCNGEINFVFCAACSNFEYSSSYYSLSVEVIEVFMDRKRLYIACASYNIITV